jgi:hypothetical protein
VYYKKSTDHDEFRKQAIPLITGLPVKTIVLVIQFKFDYSHKLIAKLAYRTALDAAVEMVVYCPMQRRCCPKVSNTSANG